MDPLAVLAYRAEQALPFTGTGTGTSTIFIPIKMVWLLISHKKCPSWDDHANLCTIFTALKCRDPGLSFCQ